MSLIDNVRQTLGEAAATARDVGQNIGTQAQAQINIKRLQLEVAKKMHELGNRTYEWHKSGNMVATGSVPREVPDLCHALDELHRQIAHEEKVIEEAKREAELRNAKQPSGVAAPKQSAAPPDTPTAVSPIPLPPAGTANHPPNYQTTILPNAEETTGNDMNATTNAANFAATHTPSVTALGPDTPSPSIPVPGPDMPSTPQPGFPPLGPQNPDITQPGTTPIPPTLPEEPTMPGQPQKPV